MNYPYPPYPPPWWRPPPPTGPHPTAIIGLITGIASLLVIPFLLGITAVVLGAIGAAMSSDRARNAGAGMGITAVALGIVGIVWAIIQVRL